MNKKLRSIPKIKIALRKDKKNAKGECPLNYYITFNGVIIKKAIGCSVNPKRWDLKKEEFVKPTCRMKSMQLDFIAKKSDFNRMILNVKSQRGGETEITRKLIDDFFEPKHEVDFYLYFENFLKSRKLTDGTIGDYKNTVEVFKVFNKGRKVLNFEDISIDMMKKFNLYLEKKGLYVNTIFNYQKMIRTIVTQACNEGVANFNPYNFFKPLKVETTLNKRIPLTAKEVYSIEKLEIDPNNIYLNYCRDFFVFLCNTGCRFNEFKNIEKSNVFADYFIHWDFKNSKYVTKPLNDKARFYFDKYASDSLNAFPKVSNSTFNLKLKIIAKLANIDKNLITHLGRHTLATELRKGGVPIADIGSILGQKKIETSLIYAKANKENLLDALKGLYGVKKIA